MKTILRLIAALLLLVSMEGFGQSAGPDQIICQAATVRMAATGTGSWTALATNPATVIIDTPSLATTNISGFTAAGIYGFKWGMAAGDTMYVTVYPAPSTPTLMLTGICLGADSLIVHGGAGMDQINWFNGSVEHSATADVGVTVCGGNGIGTAANQLYYPFGVYVDGSGNIYVCDQDNNRVQKFPAGSTAATAGVTVAGGNGYGSAANQLSYPTAVYVDGSGNIYVADGNNGRVQKFPAGSSTATNGVTVAGGNNSGSAGNQLGFPIGIYVDGSGSLYVCDASFSDRIEKFPAGSTSATNGVIVAGGNGEGNDANQLASPNAIYVDGSGNLYISDGGNDRIQKFPAGSTSATSGVTVAGGNGPGSAANQLYVPFGLSVDGSGALYVVDNLNDRIQKFPAGSSSATNGITIAGGNSAGSNANQFHNPIGLYIDGSGNIYVADADNNRVQKCVPDIIDSVYIPAVPGSYTATVVSPHGCSSLLSNAVVVNSCAADTVWPGDADNNKITDNYDLLAIGLAYDSTGPQRALPLQNNTWQADTVTDWAHYFTVYSPTVNYVHADCNGSGRIDADDTLAIVTNFSLIHAKSNSYNPAWRTNVASLMTAVSKDTVYRGDTLIITLSLGDANLPVSNIYGLAFTLNYDPIPVDSNTVSFSFINSWLGNGGNSISLHHDDRGTGTIKAALTGINHLTRTGYGSIAILRCIITTDNINGKDFKYYNSLAYITDIRAIDQLGNVIPINGSIDSAQVGYTPTGIKDRGESAQLNIYPNPAANQVVVYAETDINSISIIDVLGRQVLTKQVTGGKSQVIDISTLASGMYHVHVAARGGIGTAKLIVSR